MTAQRHDQILPARNLALALIARSVLLFGIFILYPVAAKAEKERFDRPELTVRIAPAKPYVQEEITQSVRLVSAHQFEKLNLVLRDVENADVVTVVKPTVRPFNSYGVEGFVYETVRVLYPTTSGEYLIPGVTVAGVVINDEDTKISFTRHSDDLTMTIATVPSSFEGDEWVVAKLIEMRQEYSVTLDQIRAGDTIQRKVTVTANGATGEHLPALNLRPSRGIKIAAGEPLRKTRKTPGGLVGSLTQVFDIHIQEANPTDFGPIGLIWWDSEADAQRRSALPAVRIEPLARDTQALSSQLMQEVTLTHRRSQLGIALVALLVCVVIAAIIWFNTGGRRLTPHDRRLLRESRRVKDPQAQVNTVITWAKSNYPNQEPANIDLIKARLSDEHISSQLDDLQASVYSPTNQSEIDFSRLAQYLVNNARRRRRSHSSGQPAFSRWIFGEEQRLPTIE